MSLMYLFQSMVLLLVVVRVYCIDLYDYKEADIYDPFVHYIRGGPFISFITLLAHFCFALLIPACKLLLSRKNIPHCRRPLFDACARVYVLVSFALIMLSYVNATNAFEILLTIHLAVGWCVRPLSELYNVGVSGSFLFELCYSLRLLAILFSDIPYWIIEVCNTVLWFVYAGVPFDFILF